MYKRLFPAFLLTAIMLSHSATAQIRISKAAGDKTSIDLSGLVASGTDAGRIFHTTLQKDLSLSGWFILSPKGKGEYRLLGDATPKGRNLTVKCQLYRTADKTPLISKSYRGDISRPQALAHAVADEIILTITGKRGISNTRIAMIGTMTGKKELYLCNADGSGLQQLTTDRTISVAPHWGPKGRSLIYTSYKARYPDLYHIDLTTGQRQTFSKYTALNIGGAVSPDGQYAAVVLSGKPSQPGNPGLSNPELCIKNIRTGKVTPLTRTPNASEASPSWSPDGNHIVYVSDQSGTPQLYIISRNGGAPKRLTSRGRNNTSPDWGPNGLIAYASLQGGRNVVQVINPATGEITTPPQGSSDFDEPSWAPDGRHLACTRSQNYHSQVYILDTMGDSPIALSLSKGDWYSPAWSPYEP